LLRRPKPKHRLVRIIIVRLAVVVVVVASNRPVVAGVATVQAVVAGVVVADVAASARLRTRES
jgi:hypothetical protein